MYKFILPVRYCFKRPISYLAMTAVAVCVFIVVVVMTVMNGLVVEFREKNHDFAGDCVVSTDSLVGFTYYEEFIAELEKQPFVAAVSPVIKGYGLLTQPGAEWNIGIEIAGVDPVKHSEATGFGHSLYYNSRNPANAFVPNYNRKQVGCVPGIDIVSRSRDRGGRYYHSPAPAQMELIISCFPLTAKGALAKAGTDLVNSKSFYFSDDSHSGLVKVDGRAVYIPFEQAQMLCGMDIGENRINIIHIKFTEDTSATDGSRKIAALWDQFVSSRRESQYANLLEKVTVQSWVVHRRSTIAPMEKERTMMILLFLMLGVITVFVIFVVLYMLVSHKSRDIGILKSLGVSDTGVAQVYLNFALLIGLEGGGVGLAAGCLFLAKINNIEGWLFTRYGWQLWDRSVYAIGDIPHNIELNVISIIWACATAACIAGGLLPSIAAARRKPVETLRVSQL